MKSYRPCHVKTRGKNVQCIQMHLLINFESVLTEMSYVECKKQTLKNNLIKSEIH